ncbi:MAG: DUF4402 domain-containing protein [Bacteroidales bacterium]
MKKSIIIIAVILLAGFSTKVMAQNTATINSASAAKIVATIAINPGTTGSNLEFGSMSRPATVATVTVSPASVRSKTGTISLLLQGATPKASSYATTGDVNGLYTISLPTSSTVTNGTPADDMTINNFTCSNPTPNAAAFDGTGNDSFTVGATLNLASGQAAGAYTGTFDVTVTYN